MKLAAIYNVWADGKDLLKKSIDNISPFVDGIIIVNSKLSNFGAEYDWDLQACLDSKCTVIEHNPKKWKQAYLMETDKRNVGIAIARNMGYTHFILMDCDEFYKYLDIIHTRWMFEKNKDLNATVCRTQLYFKKPTLTIGFDSTLVPFICKLTRDVELIPDYKGFPFAYVDGVPRIDPTRRPSFTDGVEMIDVIMHHYSWVRSDYDLKIENSSARGNLRRSKIKNDLASAAPGSYCSFYNTDLKECPNYFNI